jgi:hypothetical protein
MFCNTLHANAKPQRMESWGEGASEFEALKSAYKLIMADSLKLITSGTAEDSIRRTLERDLEEDLVRVKSTFFPDSSESCERQGAKVQCLSVATVRMDELEGWVRNQMQIIGRADKRVGDIKFALVSKTDDGHSRDLIVWLHNKLDRDLGHDVYYSETYIEPEILRRDCNDFMDLSEKKKKGGFEKSAEAYRAKYEECAALIDRDVVIVIKDIEIKFDQYSQRDRGMGGYVRVDIDLVQANSMRQLVSPKPRSIKKYGNGENAGIAKAALLDELYEATANYISQQFNMVISAAVKDNHVEKSQGVLKYTLVISGVNTDTREDRAKLSFIRKWFTQNRGVELERDYDRGNYGEQVYHFTSKQKIKWNILTDELYASMDDQGYDVKIDIDRSSNMLLTFKSADQQADQQIVVSYNNKKLKRYLKIENKDMVVRRRDPATGIPISLNEANVRFLNKSRKNILISIKPIWYTKEGVSEKMPFDDTKYLQLAPKSKTSFVFRAPNRYATRVSLEASCPSENCQVDK